MGEGPGAGLRLLATLDGEGTAGEHRAVRAQLEEMAGDVDAALAEYREAAALTTSLAERRYLLARAARLRQR